MSLSGLILSALVFLGALLLAQVPPQTLLNPEGILIVFGGTITAVLVSYPYKTLLGSLQAFTQSFQPHLGSLREDIEDITEMAVFVRKRGILAMTPLIQAIQTPFLKKGISMLVDSVPETTLRDSLATEIEVAYREAMDYARVFESAGGFAPTMGIIGAIIGLIQVVNSFNDPTQLGHGIASAFCATLYGVALSNLFLLPVASKLRQHAREEWFRQTLILQGILSIKTEEHPMILGDKLKAYLKESGESKIFQNVTLEESPRALAMADR